MRYGAGTMDSRSVPLGCASRVFRIVYQNTTGQAGSKGEGDVVILLLGQSAELGLGEERLPRNGTLRDGSSIRDGLISLDKR
jgi:hypothetical protein